MPKRHIVKLITYRWNSLGAALTNFVCVGGSMYVHIFACVSVQLSIHMCLEARCQCRVFLNHSLCYLLRQALSLNLELTNSVRLSGQ